MARAGAGLAVDEDGDVPGTGPHDEDDLDPELTDVAGCVDFGALRVAVPPGGAVTVEPSATGRLQALHVTLPEGRLSVSALAAPRTQRLWPDLANEIAESLREGGATVRSFPGEWGRELHARTGGSTSVFVGVDGPRWMVYGVATGPTPDAGALDVALRRLLRSTVVVRGRSPYPVRTVLPLTVPEQLREETAPASGAPAPRAEPVPADPPTERLAEVPQPRRSQPRESQPREPQPVAEAYREPPTEPAGVPAVPLPGAGPGPFREPAMTGLRAYREPATDPALRPYRPDPGPGPDPRDTVPGRHRPEPGAEPPTERVPVVPPSEPWTEHVPQVPPTGPPAGWTPAPTSARAQPALAYLMDDPMALFAEPPPGRHRRPE